MNIAIIGTGRIGITQAHIARYMHDTILWAADISQKARMRFTDIFHVQSFDNITQPDYNNIDLLWLTVKDSDIESIAQLLPSTIPQSMVILHTSGARSSDILKQYLPYNPCGSFHPLMTCPLCDVSDDVCVQAYDNIVQAYEGDSP